MSRVLLVASTTGYQVRSFDEAADRLGVELVLATDRCHVLDDPWADRAIPIRFYEHAEAVRKIADAAADRPVHGIVAVGDRPALVAAAVAERLSLVSSPPEAVRRAGHKLLTRHRFRERGLPCPWFTPVGPDETPAQLHERITFPCVVKPTALAASRGVMRADSLDQLETAVARVRNVLAMRDVRSEHDPTTAGILVEQYLPGREVAVEAVVTTGRLQTLAIFDKPDPLEGPFFEETIYVTPPELETSTRVSVEQAVSRAVTALGLSHGPVHAECRLGDTGVFVLEVAARPIGGLCSRALRFTGPVGVTVSLETVLLCHALGVSTGEYRREPQASGVMMIPIPCDGRYRGVTGLDRAHAVRHVEAVVVTAKPDQRIRPLPEGGSYLGFIFARAATPQQVVAALRNAHAQLVFDIVPAIPVETASAFRD